MPYNLFIHAFLAGLISTGLFMLVVMLGLGFFFLFLPTLPLLWLGLGRTPKLALLAAMMATLIIATLIDLPTGSFFFLIFGMPSWYISRLSLLSRQDGEHQAWFPLGLIYTRLVLYACLLVTLTTLYYTTQPFSLDEALSQQIRSAFSNLGSEYADTIELLAGKWLFLILPMGIWLWTMALYAHAWIINRALARKSRNIRPHYAVTLFPMPSMMLMALIACAALSLSGSTAAAFFGKSMVIALLCPYFFLGAALMHETAKSWPNRRFFLFFVYLMVFVQFWPALILSGAGLFHHIKHLSSAGGSSRS